VKAITFAAPIPTYLLTLAAGALSRRLLVGPHACTRFGDVSDPVLPNDHWVTVRTRLGGICGSDLAIVGLGASPSTSPFSSFPFVIGHENVGVIEAVGPAVTTLSVGQRVVANPLLPCGPRAIDPPCAACREGRPSRCEHFTDGALPPGVLIGTTRGLGGSWGERFVAHAAQVHAVPDGVSDEAAVMVEPFACCVHALGASLPEAGERVLVVGAGTIGLLTIAALRALAPGVVITAIARHAFQAEHAIRLGAARALTGRDERALAEAAGARLLKTVIGPRAAVGGFDRTFVCVSGAKAMDDALRFTHAGCTVVLLGNVRHLDGLDWTPLWMKELTLKGSVTYGGHPGASDDAFGEALTLIAGGHADLAPLVTHTFPLAEHSRALDAAMGKAGAKSVKVAFRF
jgi:L-iditol 2-dehydrogenase